MFDEFSFLHSAELRMEMLVELAESLPKLASPNQGVCVPDCVSGLWVSAHLDQNGLMQAQSLAKSGVIQGVTSLLCYLVSGCPANACADVCAEVATILQVEQLLTTTRKIAVRGTFNVIVGAARP